MTNKVSENFSYLLMNITNNAVHNGDVLIRTRLSESDMYFSPSNIREAPIAPNIPLDISLDLTAGEK